MILLHLFGGLGNQLFQYAAGKALSEHLGDKLKMDKTYYDQKEYENDPLNSFFDVHIYRNILENVFEITAPEASLLEVEGYRPSFTKKVIERLDPYYRRSVFKQKGFSFDKHFFSARRNIILKGYWQSENFFKPYESQVRKDLTFRNHIIERNNEMMSFFTTSTIGIHIRRGDYVANPIISKYHGALGMDYYNKAIKYIVESAGNNIQLIVFSDDIEWCKHNFIQKATLFVDKSFHKNHIDEFYLMSRCTHNIIANSSYSWWAAYLNKTKEKIVVAPKNWFSDPTYINEDIIPDKWIQI